VPLASLFLLISIDPVVSEEISKTKDKMIAANTVRKIASELEKSCKPGISG